MTRSSSRLITTHADPVVKGIIRYKLHLRSQHAAEQAEADDIHQEVLLQLRGELRQFRVLPDTDPIADVRGLAAPIAHRVCSRVLKEQVYGRYSVAK